MTKSPEIVEEGDIDGEVEVDEASDHRAAMEAAFDDAMAKAEDDGEETDLNTEDEPTPRKERERDESGKFTKKSKQALQSGADETIEQPQTEVIEPLRAEIPVLAPPGWAADAREQFNQLPARLQQEVVKRETDLRRGLQQATDRATQVAATWSEVDQALAPKAEIFRRNGVTPGRVVAQLMAWQDHLDRNPIQALSDLAQSYGLDLAQVAQQRAQQPQEPAYVRELRQKVQQVEGLLTQEQQMKQQQQQQNVVSEIQAFAGETDAQGNALRPYVEHVVDDMLPIMVQLRGRMPVRQLLQTAYEKAIWANPSTRELELRRSQAVQKPSLEKARRASKIVNGDARSMNVSDDPTDSRSAMSAVWDKHHGK